MPELRKAPRASPHGHARHTCKHETPQAKRTTRQRLCANTQPTQWPATKTTLESGSDTAWVTRSVLVVEHGRLGRRRRDALRNVAPEERDLHSSTLGVKQDGDATQGSRVLRSPAVARRVPPAKSASRRRATASAAPTRAFLVACSLRASKAAPAIVSALSTKESSNNSPSTMATAPTTTGDTTWLAHASLADRQSLPRSPT